MIEEVVVDCADPTALAHFWAAVTGGIVHVRDPDWVTVRDDPEAAGSAARRGPGVTIAFQRVPEAKSVKNRLHLDLTSPDIASDTRAAVGLGAIAVGEIVVDSVGSFQVLTDPEGNEFCLVTSP